MLPKNEKNCLKTCLNIYIIHVSMITIANLCSRIIRSGYKIKTDLIQIHDSFRRPIKFKSDLLNFSYIKRGIDSKKILKRDPVCLKHLLTHLFIVGRIPQWQLTDLRWELSLQRNHARDRQFRNPTHPVFEEDTEIQPISYSIWRPGIRR